MSQSGLSARAIRTIPHPGAAGGPIMLVEDDPDIRSVLSECLEESGFELNQAADGHRARQLLAQGLRPALLITDINLGPGETGVSLADGVRETCPAASVIFITGRLDMLRDRGLRPGEYVLPKPFPLSALLGMTRKLLEEPAPAPCH